MNTVRFRKHIGFLGSLLAFAAGGCGDATTAPRRTDALARASMTQTPPGKGLVSGIPTSCDNNTTMTVTIVRGGPPGIGPAWFDDGTHTVAQSVTLVVGGQVVYEAQWGKKIGQLPVVTCGGPFPWGDEMGQITVVSVIQP